MKKLLLLSLIAMGTMAYGKEITAIPVIIEESVVETKDQIIEKEEIITPTAVMEEVVVEDIIQPKKNNVYLRTGLDVWSQYDSHSIYHNNEGIKLTNGKSKKMGFEVAVEGTRSLTNNIEVGLGVAYQNHAKAKSATIVNNEITAGKYDSAPVYVTGKYTFDGFSNGIRPYVKANVGYSFNFNEKDGVVNGVKYNTNVDDGLYYGAGVGMEYNNMIMDVMYQANQAKMSGNINGVSSKKSSFDYSRVTLSVGYKFSY